MSSMPASIARNRDGSSSVKFSKLGAQDTPNRLSIEFQDSFNQYQQDSLSLAKTTMTPICAVQEVAVDLGCGGHLDIQPGIAHACCWG